MIAAKVHNAHFKEKVTLHELVPGVKADSEKQDVEAAIKRQLGIVG